MSTYFTLDWIDGKLRLLDQRRLPHELIYLDYEDYHQVAEAIRDMVVRGAPAIGAAAAYGLALAAQQAQAGSIAELQSRLEEAALVLGESRPTAVNLSWALARVMRRVRTAAALSPAALAAEVLAEAQAIAAEDVQVNRSIGLNALPLVPDPAVFIHHCNTGTLATVGYGTALGIIRVAHEAGRKVFVYVDETRPRLQGARLTAWELQQLGIPHAVIVDGASGWVMSTRGADLSVVGCDRVAANGDTANKIGTFNLALAARAHGVPFYVAAPTSTIDLSTPDGKAIPIEMRTAREVTHIGGEQVTPAGAEVLNPAFDVTPAEYITAIITEAGVAYPPYEISLPAMLGRVEQA